MEKLLPLLFIILGGASLQAEINPNKAVYIDANYTGVERGTEAAPYISLADISNKKIGPGTVVLLKRGSIFRESFAPVYMKGTLEAPVRVEAYGEGLDPVICGTQKIEGWEDHNLDGIWRAPASGHFSSFFINSEKQVLARYPNKDAENDGWLRITARPPKAMLARTLISDELKDADYWDGATCVMRAAAWEESVLPIEGWDNASKTLRFGDDIYLRGKRYSIGWGFYIENIPQELDAPGEWYHDRKASMLYYKKPDSVDFAVDKMEVSVLKSGFELSADNAYIQFKNLRFEGFQQYGILGKLTGNITIDSCSFKNIGHADIFFAGDVDSGEIKNITIKNSIFKASNKQCIHLEIVDGYAIENNRTDGNHHTAILVSEGGNGSIKGNTIRNTGYNGIHLSRPVENNTIESNLVDGFCSEFTDGGGIYTWDNMPMITGNPADARTVGWNHIKNNIVMNGHTQHAASGNSHHSCYGIYLDDNATKWIVSENIVISPGNVSYMLHNTRETAAYNNLFYGGNKCNIYVLESAQVGKWWLAEYGTDESMSDNNLSNNTCYIDVQPEGDNLAVNINWTTRYGSPNNMLKNVDFNRYYNPFQGVVCYREYFSSGNYWNKGQKEIERLTLADLQNDTGLDLENHSLKFPHNEEIPATELSKVRLEDRGETDPFLPLVNTNRTEAAFFSIAAGSYVDSKGNPVESPIQLSAWSAKILIREGLFQVSPPQGDSVKEFEIQNPKLP